MASAARSGAGRSVRSANEVAPDRCAPSSTCPARYAGSPRASSHAASWVGSISLIAGGGPAIGPSVTAPEDQEHVVEEGQQRGQRAGDVRPGCGLQDRASAILALPDHAAAVHECERLARRADLDRQRREGEDHRRAEADEADDREPGDLEDQARDDEPRGNARAELRGRDDRLPQLHRRVARCVLDRVTHLVGDDGRGRHREPWCGGRHTGGRERRGVGDLGADAQHLAARIVVIGQLARGRLDADALEALAVEQTSREVERVDVDARIHLGPLAIGRLHAPRRPAGDGQRGDEDDEDVDGVEETEHVSSPPPGGLDRVYPNRSDSPFGRMAARDLRLPAPSTCTME